MGDARNVLGDVRGMSWGTFQASVGRGTCPGSFERPSRAYVPRQTACGASAAAGTPDRIPWGESVSEVPQAAETPGRIPWGESAPGIWEAPRSSTRGGIGGGALSSSTGRPGIGRPGEPTVVPQVPHRAAQGLERPLRARACDRGRPEHVRTPLLGWPSMAAPMAHSARVHRAGPSNDRPHRPSRNTARSAHTTCNTTPHPKGSTRVAPRSVRRRWDVARSAAPVQPTGQNQPPKNPRCDDAQ